MVKTFAEIEGYTKEQIFDALGNFEVRKQWDKVLTELKVIETNHEDNSEILYSAIKVIIFLLKKLATCFYNFKKRFRPKKKNMERGFMP